MWAAACVGEETEGVIPGRLVVPGAEGPRNATSQWITFAGQARACWESGGVVVMDADNVHGAGGHADSCGSMRTKAAGGASRPRGNAVAEEDPHAGGRRRRVGERHSAHRELSRNMVGRTFCPLGDAAAMPTIAFVDKFREESRRT